jgi:serine phosphatase RsbU (regulator of sigma subunit)
VNKREKSRVRDLAVTIPQLPFAVVAGRNIPCSEIGGDFFSVTTIDEGVVVAIADVCGKAFQRPSWRRAIG